MSATIYVSLLTFFLGLILGHPLSLWRERRKEFNEVAVRIRATLKDRLDKVQPYYSSIKKTDMELFTHLLSWRKRRGLATAWANYEAECENTAQDSYGQVYYKQPERVAKALELVISFTSLR